jgi:hypothetical protein
MAIRKLRVSFDVDVEVFAQLLAHGNSGMNIEVFGTDGAVPAPSVKRVNHTRAIEAHKDHPAKKQMIILEELAKGRRTLMQIKEVIAKSDFSPDISSCMALMLSRKLIKRTSYATYAIGTKGAEYVNVEAV